MKWKIIYYSKTVKNEILKLPAGILARFIRYTDVMEKYGPYLGMPHTRSLGNGLYELRLKASEGVVRALFCSVIDNRIVFFTYSSRKQRKLRVMR